MTVQKAAHRELAQRLGTVDRSGADVFEVLSQLLPRAYSGQHYGIYDVELAEHGPQVGRFVTDALPEAVYRDHFAQGALHPEERRAVLFNPLRPEPSQRNRVVTAESLSRLTKSPPTRFFTEVMPRHGLRVTDQLRVLVCNGASLLAFVGLLRIGGAFTLEQRHRLQSLVPLLRDRLLDQELLEQATGLGNVLSSALEQMPGEAWVVKTRGAQPLRVVCANAAGIAAFDADPRAILTAIGTLLRGGRLPGWACTRVEAHAAPGHALVTRRQSGGAGVERVAQAVRRWGLTARQAQVLALVAQGRANKEIAIALGCREATVEYHLTRIFHRAEAESRAALVAKLWAI